VKQLRLYPLAKAANSGSDWIIRWTGSDALKSLRIEKRFIQRTGTIHGDRLCKPCTGSAQGQNKVP
jgi:hypothetical protein